MTAAPVYVVGGWMRSGTSMMMRALQAGGMPAVYRESRDAMRRRFADSHYDPNAGGLYELEYADYMRPGFPAGFEGKLIKALRRGPARMTRMPGGIKVVYMLRDAEEQRQSYLAFFGGTPPSVARIASETRRNLQAIGARDGIALLTVAYADVVAAPVEQLGRVAGFFGVPLDVAAAAEVVDPNLYRYRAGELVPGIV